jgi:hypothetical protein
MLLNVTICLARQIYMSFVVCVRSVYVCSFVLVYIYRSLSFSLSFVLCYVFSCIQCSFLSQFFVLTAVLAYIWSAQCCNISACQPTVQRTGACSLMRRVGLINFVGFLFRFQDSLFRIISACDFIVQVGARLHLPRIFFSVRKFKTMVAPIYCVSCMHLFFCFVTFLCFIF